MWTYSAFSWISATKRVAEMLAECMNGTSKRRFMAVRFGNVVGSSGSVIPIFQDQIARGGPVTVTHREVTRYFMSIPEAALLILQAPLNKDLAKIALASNVFPPGLTA
jgi:FlaA1/EpsC-like NDP-sugar epimerase